MKWKKGLRKWLRLGKEKDSGWSRSDLLEVNPKWQKAVVFICSRCGDRLESEEPDLKSHVWADGLRRWLKMKLVQDLCWGKKVRVVTTQCLDICAKGRMTVFVSTMGINSSQKIFLVNPVLHRKKIYEKIRSLF